MTRCRIGARAVGTVGATALAVAAALFGAAQAQAEPSTEAPAGAATTALPAPVPCAPTCWRPDLDTSWQWKLNAPPTRKQIDSTKVELWDVDGFETTTSKVARIRQHSAAVCYLSAGSYEAGRPDATDFPGAAQIRKKTGAHETREIIGWKLDGWNERWLDIRGINKAGSSLAAIMTARIEMCRDKGFDGIEFDNVDGYTNKTGFPLTGKHQLSFNIWLANTAHANGLAAILKNDVGQIPRLLPYFDAALNEQCWQYRECTTKRNGAFGYDQFVDAGKAVFGVEYQGSRQSFCPKANAQNFNWLEKRMALGSWRKSCR